MRSVRVLVVEPDTCLAEVFGWLLELERVAVSRAGSGHAALASARADPPAVVVVEADLPDTTGELLLRDLRAFAPEVGAVLMVTPGRPAYPPEPRTERLVKPFAMEQLLARVRRLTPSAARSEASLMVGDLVLDEDAYEVRRSGRAIRLSLTEFELLRFFMRNPGRVLPKSQILARVWDYEYAGDPHVVENYVSYLRRKIDRGRQPMIRTVRGVGYVLDAAS